MCWLVFFALGANKVLAAQSGQKFSLYNLSILFPLPKTELSEAWGFAASGCKAPLLSLDLFSSMPAMLRVPLSPARQYEDMRLVGMRFDPVQSETRLVFQLLIWAAWAQTGPSFWCEDAAIHLFFKTEVETILKWQRQLQVKFGDLNTHLLGVHPKFKDMKNAADLTPIICELAARGVVKVTFMNVRGARVLWNFGGFHVERNSEGELSRATDVAIPNAEGVFVDPEERGASVQRVARLSGAVRAGVLPKPNRGDHLMEFFLNEAANSVPDPISIRTVVDRIENPKLNTPHSVDCVSCHATESTRRWLEARYPARASSSAYNLPVGHGLDTSVSESSLGNTANFRSFGYLDGDAVVSRRVLHESAEVQRFFEER